LIAKPTSFRQRILSIASFAEALDLVAGHPSAELPGHDILDRQHLRGAAVHQLHALARQIAHHAVLPGQDRACRRMPSRSSGPGAARPFRRRCA